MQAETSADQPRHPIQVVARRTALTPDVLRAWERRYAAVTPHRTDTGRRLYSDTDVERLILLRAVTSAGRAIRQVANLTLEALRDLANEDAEAMAQQPSTRRSPTSTGSHLDRALDAVSALNADRLRASLGSASMAMSRTALIEQLIAPLMLEVGERWHDGRIRIAHEHMATSVIQSHLSDLLRTRSSETAPSVVIATPAGQRHQLGAMMAASSALAEGWHVVYLGADLPAEDIAAAAAQTQARAVALSIVFPPDDPMLPGELRAIRDLVSPDTAFFVGGRAADAYGTILSELGVKHVDSLTEFGRELSDRQNARG